MNFKKITLSDREKTVRVYKNFGGCDLTNAELKRIYNALLIDYKSDDKDDPDLEKLIHKIGSLID
jgi:hypothetical protein